MASVRDLPVFDAATHLDSPEAMAYFLADAIDTGDSAFIGAAFDDAARSKGMAKLSSQTGLTREQLYSSLSANGSPTRATFLAELKSFGIELRAVPARKKKHRAVG